MESTTLKMTDEQYLEVQKFFEGKVYCICGCVMLQRHPKSLIAQVFIWFSQNRGEVGVRAVCQNCHDKIEAFIWELMGEEYPKDKSG